MTSKKFIWLALCLALGGAAQLSAQTRTTIRDTLYNADGSKAGGQVEITWNAFKSADGKTIAAGKLVKRITDGVLDLALVPNSGSTPDGTSYAVTYLLANSLSYAETWLVPQSETPVSVAAVRVSAAPALSDQVGQHQIYEGSGFQVLVDFYRAASQTANRAGQCYWNTPADTLHCSTGAGSWQSYLPAISPTINGPVPAGASGHGLEINALSSNGGVADLYGIKIVNQSAGTNNYNLWSGATPTDALIGSEIDTFKPKNVFTTVDDWKPAIYGGRADTIAGGGGWAIGVMGDSSTTATGPAIRSTIGVLGSGFKFGPSSVAETFGVVGSAEVDAGTATLAAGIAAGASASSAGTIASDLAGVYVFNNTASGGATITNNYGVWIRDQTVGANNWAIKTGAGKVEFGDEVHTKKLNGTALAHLYPGADAGAKIAAAYAALPATGGTVDARGLQGVQAFSTDVFSNFTTSKPVELLLGEATISTTVKQTLSASSTTIRGAARDKTILQYTAAGAADAVLKIGTATPSLTGVEGLLFENFTVKGNANVTNGLYLTGTHRSVFRNLAARDVTGAGFLTEFAVANTYDSLSCSGSTTGFVTQPATGLELGQIDGTHTSTASSIITPIMEGVSGNGIVLSGAAGNVLIGGTSENNGARGILVTSGSVRNTVKNLFMEGNTTEDVLDNGAGTVYENCIGEDLFHVGAAASNTVVTGGIVPVVTIDAGATSVSLTNVAYTTLTDGGTGTGVRSGNAEILPAGLYYYRDGAGHNRVTLNTIGVYPVFTGRDNTNNLSPVQFDSGVYVTTGNTYLGTSIASYNNIGTVANGVPAEYGTVDLTAQTAAIGATTIYANPASIGQYRVCYFALTKKAGNAVNLATKILFTTPDDSSTAQTITSANVAMNTVGAYTQDCPTIVVKASTNIQYQTTLSGGIGAGQYGLWIKVEKL